MLEETKSKITDMIQKNEVVLFMKGDRQQPMCGFSAQVVHALEKHKTAYETFNVLEDYDVREGIKEYSSWPTIPQLYVRGEFIGGCDIVMSLDRKDELQKTLSPES